MHSCVCSIRQMLIKIKSKPHSIMIYSKCSITRPVWEGYHYQARRNYYKWRVWCLQSDYIQSDHGSRSCHRGSTALAHQNDTKITHVIILTDFMNLLQKSGVWDGLPWLTCSHAHPSAARTTVAMLESEEMKKQEDRQAQQALNLVYSLARQKYCETRGTLRAIAVQSITALIAWSKEGGAERKRGGGERSSQWSSIWGWEWFVLNQASTCIVVSTALGRLPRDLAEHVWVFCTLQCYLVQ